MKNKQYLSKLLLSTSLMGFLTLAGALQGNLMAQQAPINMKDAGATVQIQPDGTKLIQAPNGSSIQIKPDGTKIIKKADGTIVQIKPDGSKFIQDAEGTTIQVAPDGTKSVKKADGSTIQIKPGQGNFEDQH